MRIAIIGTGAMGSIYAALFAEHGHQVWAVDTWADHVAAINARGLRLDGASGDRVVRGITATTQIGDVPPCDVYVIATKGSGVGPAAQALAAQLPPDAMVLTIQNGLGAGARIANHMSVDNVILGVADGFGASMKGPGHAHHNAMKLIRLGEMSGGMTPRLQGLQAAWVDAGFQAQAFADIHQLIWEKFICNVALSGPCTLFNCTIGQVVSHPEWRKISLGCLAEAFAAGLAEGIAFSFADPVAYLEKFVGMMPDARPSMLQDHLVGRVSEIDAINGMVPIVSARHGLATPYNDTVSALVRRAEEAF